MHLFSLHFFLNCLQQLKPVYYFCVTPDSVTGTGRRLSSSAMQAGIATLTCWSRLSLTSSRLLQSTLFSGGKMFHLFLVLSRLQRWCWQLRIMISLLTRYPQAPFVISLHFYFMSDKSAKNDSIEMKVFQLNTRKVYFTIQETSLMHSGVRNAKFSKVSWFIGYLPSSPWR